MSFRIELLPAREGDCVLLSYADGAVRRHVLIDGGRAATWEDLKARLEELPAGERELELLVISHIDRDHIEGVLKMLGDPACPVTFKDIWFNGYGHLKAVDDEDFGAVQGEKLTELLLAGLPWNRSFSKKSVRLPKTTLGQPIDLPGGMRLTLMSPTADKLIKLRPKWEKECKKADLLPSHDLPPEVLPGEEPFGALDVDALADEAFDEDGAEANGSSIALLAEHGGRRALLAADAHPSVLLDAFERLQPGGDPIFLHAFKLAHHGSRNNLSVDFLKRIKCSKYLISTNGSQFRHPSRQAIARLLKYGGPQKTLVFNYKTEFTEIWDENGLQNDYDYAVRFGNKGHVTVDV
jgi:hypothetical protein